MTVEPGDAVYLSLTVYGGPNDGRYSERIVGPANSRDAGWSQGGSFRLVVSPEPPSEPDVAWIKLEPDAVAAITRDYLEDPASGLRAKWHIQQSQLTIPQMNSPFLYRSLHSRGENQSGPVPMFVKNQRPFSSASLNMGLSDLRI